MVRLSSDQINIEFFSARSFLMHVVVHGRHLEPVIVSCTLFANAASLVHLFCLVVFALRPQQARAFLKALLFENF
jgi:hypothetical protein